jgi:MFS transporter, NNP family, nitrate/nitrite transporter
VAAVYLPLIVLAALLVALGMDNVDAVRSAPGALREAAGERHTWWICLLYIGTFGSYVGFGFAFGLVLRYELNFTALEAASFAFLGPLLGSLTRPLGGLAADRWGGAWVTLWAFAGMAAGAVVLLLATSQHSFALFLIGFIVLFVLSGVGNGSTYRMISTVFVAHRLSGAVMGITGAVGALGGAAVNLSFFAAYGAGAGGGPAFLAFLGYYGLCAWLTWRVYLRGGGPVAEVPAMTAEPSRV